MRTPCRISAVLGLALAAIPGAALAQSSDIPDDRAIDVQTFEYAIGPKTFFTVADADVASKKQLAVDALVTYLTKPFKIFNVDPDNPDMVGSERTIVVESLAAAQITAAYGVTDKLQVGANLPLIFALNGDGLDASTGNGAMNGLSVTGVGDLLVEGKLRLYREGKLRVAGAAGVTLPTSIGSGGSEFIGDNLPTLRARMALQVDPTPMLSLGVNTGILLRKPRTIYDSTIGPQFTWGAAAALRVTERFSIIGESYGRAGLPDFSLDSSPLEVEGGLRIYATNAVAVVVGGGAGLVKGIGSPEARFFVSLGYAPDVRDSDGDGIPNGRDKCLLVPEDKDGTEDDDGCPDDDNDGDRRPDTDDKCPTEAEDLDGFDDDDGCPELDNDKDGMADMQDKCPMDAEDGAPPHPKDGCPANKRDTDGDGIHDGLDKCFDQEEDVDGFEDGDGCPEADNDNDGLADGADACALCPEDKDGFQDADGCPDLDNDKDGIADAKDRCAMEPETLNGITDDDGCPDTGGVTLVRLDGDRLILDKVPALAGKALSVSGGQQVDQIAMVMRSHDEVTKWLLALAQPKPEAATLLADLIKARLIARGVPADRIQVIGAVGKAKIGGVVQERAEASPAASCTANLQVQPRPEASLSSAPAKTPAAPDEVAIAADKDTDGDDFADANDKCVDQPETLNSYEDDDGCPDTVPAPLQKFSGTIQGINFKSGKSDLLPVSLKLLDDAAKAFLAFPGLRVEIQGHTDDAPPLKGGAFADNNQLSQARADAVKDYLAKQGVDVARLTAKGFGDTRPLIPIATVKGRALKAARTKNRRVEFKLLVD
jgi:outer membrane protein OmpA-like peptidoglycan-associated protein